MGNREMPPVADFVKIEPLTPEMVLEIGWLPQCEGISGKHCGREPSFTIDGNFYCVTHKMVIVERWEMMIEEWVKRPARAQDSDLELLELIRDELKPPVIEVYPRVNVAKVIKDLSLSNDSAGRNLAAWYLWEMGIFDIHDRVGFFN